MNGLTLRISGSKGKRTKTNLACNPVAVPLNLIEDKENKIIRDFIQSTNAEDQLTVLKTFLSQNKENYDLKVIKFLVIVFLHAEVKHPVKCFLTRYITRTPSIAEPFTKLLIIEINNYIANEKNQYTEYIDVVSKIGTCLENFPPGAAALQMTEIKLSGYLKGCLKCCIQTLRASQKLSPTEKNEIFNLVHLTLRILLYIVQKVLNDNRNCLISTFTEIRLCIEELLFDDDVPMDTRSVCGILYLSMHVLENGPNSWIDVLTYDKQKDLNQLLEHEAAKLSLYSAVATTVSADMLHHMTVDGHPAVIALLENIIFIGERNSSEATITLGVTRSVVQISKTIDNNTEPSLGLRLVEELLTFVWTHLEHHMDSVRHLTVQVLSSVVGYCTRLKRNGDTKALDHLFTAMSHLDRSRKSYYVSVTSLAAQLGAACVMRQLPGLVCHVIQAVSIQAVQASATTTLETLLEKHIHESRTETVYEQWVQPILSHVAGHTLDSSVHSILEGLLTRAVRSDREIIEYILPCIKQRSEELSTGCGTNLKCVLMLLSVVRKSHRQMEDRSVSSAGDPGDAGGEDRSDGMWRGLIGYRVLRTAAVHASDEIRSMSLSLIVESPKSTEPFTEGELSLLLQYLKYNINAQSPNFRQLTLSLLKKFMKRFEDSYKVLKRQSEPQCSSVKVHYYLTFIEDLRRQCFDSLVQGANYSRRYVALQILLWCEQLHLDGYDRVWTEDYIEKLLFHLEDSYETNKAFVLDILDKCPGELLENKKYTISLEMNDILREASSVKPTDCVSAAYKLLLLKRKLPTRILQESQCDAAEPVSYLLVRRLLGALRRELAECERSVVRAAGRAPLYGLLHCVRHLVDRLDARAIEKDDKWRALVAELIATCMAVNDAVGCVVNNSSPEGHLPMDVSGVEVTDHGNSGEIRLTDGRQVTAQMVLLCAWRSVKEVSLLLGSLCSRLTIAGEGGAHGTLDCSQLRLAGEHLMRLLTETKHRGAFEQAYLGFTSVLARLWRCRGDSLHGLPRAWLARLAGTLAAPHKGALCATRRSAGLPYIVQALLTTELQVEANPKCFHECMATLLRLAAPPAPQSPAAADPPSAVETRTHCANVLRALFRSSALEGSVAAYVGDGLVAALRGFEGRTWMERNSSTLLFSALMVRTFGVQRSRDSEQLCIRNRMTGRIFFLRYPRLYDLMLEKLKEVSGSREQLLHPALYPVLLLLSRLYPSSLEGTVSNLKLASFVPHVAACARSSVLTTRQLAARAVVPLVAPHLYLAHLEAMFALICDEKIPRNFCHGILLQIIRLLDARPDSLVVEGETADRLGGGVEGTLWILRQGLGDRPCYILVDEFNKMINLILWRFPSVINEDILFKIKEDLENLLFHTENLPKITFGREICLANAFYLLIIISNKLKHDCTESIIKSLSHDDYEVILSALNSLLIAYKQFHSENCCKFQEHLIVTLNPDILQRLRANNQYIKSLSHILKTNKYLECINKCLKVLTLEQGTERNIIEVKVGDDCDDITDDVVLEKLFVCIRNEHENLTHIYLESLSSFVNKKLASQSICALAVLDVLRLMFELSSADNGEETRSVIVKFLEENCFKILDLDLVGLSTEEKFEYRATFWAIVTTLLDDDECSLRLRCSKVIVALAEGSAEVVPSRAAGMMLDLVEGSAGSDAAAMFVVLALLDYRCQVCTTDDGSDECRVFDQNERYNVFLEESIRTAQCVDKIIQSCGVHGQSVVELVQSVVNNPVYAGTFEKLCNGNIVDFKKTFIERCNLSSDINPKIELFVRKLLC